MGVVKIIIRDKVSWKRFANEIMSLFSTWIFLSCFHGQLFLFKKISYKNTLFPLILDMIWRFKIKRQIDCEATQTVNDARSLIEKGINCLWVLIISAFLTIR
jgi:hypothetical protein